MLVGGGAQGQGPLPHAQAVYVDPAAAITADALDQGNGGKVVVWSDQYTNFNGTITARGGANGGNGGSIETSSRQILAANGVVDASAPRGTAGDWRLDPFNVTIATTTSNGTFSGGNPDNFNPSANSAIVNYTTINTALAAGTDVAINTNTGGGQTGNITVAAGTALTNAPATRP